MSDRIAGPVGDNGLGYPAMTPEIIEAIAAESRVWRGRFEEELESCLKEIKAADNSTHALFTELRGHIERSSYWTCDMHDHQGLANGIIDILAARATAIEEMEAAAMSSELSLTTDPKHPHAPRLATVGRVFRGCVIQVIPDVITEFDDVTDLGDWRHLAHYEPAEGDHVILGIFGEQEIILGKVAK